MRIPAEKWSFSLVLSDGQECSGTDGSSEIAGGRIELSTSTVPFGYRIQLRFFPRRQQEISACHLVVPTSCKPEDRLLCNGFQSWTESYWRRPDESIPQLRSIARPLMGNYGDYHIDWIKRGPGYLHSWSWTERRRFGEATELIASLNENTAFSCLQWEQQQEQLRIEIDCRGWQVEQAVTLADFLVLEGSVNEIYDEWTSALQLPALRAQPARGWTSWYQHYTNISEEIIEENLRAFKQRQTPLEFFQIDDGYQTAVGDWLSIDKKFPNGMKAVAASIRKQGPEPGLWLAPCVVDSRSETLRKHPEWLQLNARGKPRKAGYNPLWKGWYYALNTEHPGWQDHIQQVLQTMVQDWGFALLKLDFLFAACIYPTPQFTRAQLMRRALEQIQASANGAYLLGCGTPLASGFGIFDYCRIGADIHLRWEYRLLRWFRQRERVSTLAALRSVLGRYPLAGRMWRNDPDVYLLRDENIQMPEEERALVHRLNTWLGELLFTSDNPATYGDFQAKEEAWQKENWQRRNWVVEPEPDGRFRLSSGAEQYFVELGRKTGKITKIAP